MGREDEVVSLRLHDQIAHCHRGEMVAFKLCPGLPTIDRNPESELRPEKKHLFLACVFLNDMRIAADAFAFLRTTVLEQPEHKEFSKSTAPIDRKRAASGFEYAQAHTYDLPKAARAIFTYATLPGRRVDSALYRAAEQGRQPNNLFYEARQYVWQDQQ